MTERVNALTVVFEKDLAAEDVKVLVDMIQQLKGVLTVQRHSPEIMFEYVVEQRVRDELGRKLLAIVYPKWGQRDR